MPGAGELSERVTFQRKGLDVNGDPLGPWEEPGLTVWAKIVYLRGGETVTEQRLQGVRPCVITVRDSRDLREVTSAWRGRGATPRIAGVEFALKSAEPSRDVGFIDLLAEARDV